MTSSTPMDRSSGMVLLAGNSHPHLAKLISEHLQVPLADVLCYNKPCRETEVEIRQSVRAKHVFILQTSSKDVNNDIWEAMILIYTCRTSDAKSITVVMPFLPYSMQCCVTGRSALPMKLVADMICKAGATHIVSLDLYRKEIQGFFGVPVENLRASPFLLHYICHNIPDYRNAVIVAKSPKVMDKASSYAERLRVSIAVIHGEAKNTNTSLVSGQYLPLLDERGTVLVPGSLLKTMYRSAPSLEMRNDAGISLTYEIFPLQAVKMKPPLTVVGDVGGKIAILIDDIIDEAQSFIAAAQILKERGAYKIYVIATHGLLSADAPAVLEDSVIDQVIVTNTVPHEMQKLRCHKIETVDISLLICDAIRRIYNQESMAQLFRSVSVND
uniref:Ribose-phosphate pyrophosphokinase N-terminal domain-containing protein n=1 Tax=Setaria digitata TaxID=48799 RepID=A0A915Q537_9BILA